MVAMTVKKNARVLLYCAAATLFVVSTAANAGICCRVNLKQTQTTEKACKLASPQNEWITAAISCAQRSD